MRRPVESKKGAPIGAPFFYALASAAVSLFIAALPSMATEAQSDCFDKLTREQASVERVSDGDTIVLTDQRKVRLIGINTPELNARHPTLKSHAIDATQQLKRWLPRGKSVWLYIGTEPHDRHGRQLAHVVRTQDDLAVAEQLLHKGLAAQSAVKPNTLCAEQFAAFEKMAVSKKLGLWKNRKLLTISAGETSRNTAGFKLVNGVVSHVKHTKQYSELRLDDAFSVQVRKKLAKKMALDDLLGRSIEVRGWIISKKSQPYLWLQHKANLSHPPTGR